jgi:hypothetical protein
MGASSKRSQFFREVVDCHQHRVLWLYPRALAESFR